MGTFKAFQADNDQPAQLATTLNEYYGSIVKAAFPTYFEAGAIDIAPLQGAPGYGDIDLWSQGMRLIGYIPQDGHQARTVDAILSRITDEENKYYYKWMGDLDDLAKDGSDNDVLIALRRVNALVYYNIITDTIQRGQLTSSWTILGLEKNIFLPIAISLDAYFLENGKYFFGVYTNADAVPLFLDTDDENKNYIYKEENLVYKRQPTAKPAADPQPLSTIIKGFDSKTFDNLQLPDERKKYWLIMQIKKPNNRGRLKDKLPDSLKPTSQYKTFWGQQILTLLDCFLDEYRKEMSDAATDAAAQLPIGYKCFYYSKANELAGVLSNVNIGEGRRGSGGYAMRADRVEEVAYQWHIEAVHENWNLAFVLSHMMGLDEQYQMHNPQAIDGSYFPTNWLVGRGPAGTSWNHYYKKFRNDVARRNAPPDPTPPRTSNPADQDPKKYVKLDNRSYRVWKKGSDFAGEVLADGTAALRQPAGSVMAAALSDFGIYDDMVKQNQKITRSSLPATQFVRYVLSHDEAVEGRWAEDNSDRMEIDGGKQLLTDQEWCHLYGHGDGGLEELGNFVAGSKHCNTEQLAIETGQRRVTHNRDTETLVKGKIKAKITAYLFPDQGAWSERVFTGNELHKAFDWPDKAANEYKRTFQEWWAGFFEPHGDGSPAPDDSAPQPMDTADDGSPEDNQTYNMKPPKQVRDAYTNLSQAITKKGDNPPSNEVRQALFKFRRNLERGFFLHLPVARWMRYKIYYGNNKIFDHVYDAQSQSFDYHEAQILDYTVERIIYQAMASEGVEITTGTKENLVIMSAWDYYKAKIADRISDLIPTPEEINDIDNALNIYSELKWIFSANSNSVEEAEEIYIDQLSDLKKILPSTSKRPKTGDTDSTAKLIAQFYKDINPDEIVEAIDAYIDNGRDSEHASALTAAISNAIENAAETEKQLEKLRKLYIYYQSMQ